MKFMLLAGLATALFVAGASSPPATQPTTTTPFNSLSVRAWEEAIRDAGGKVRGGEIYSSDLGDSRKFHTWTATVEYEDSPIRLETREAATREFVRLVEAMNVEVEGMTVMFMKDRAAVAVGTVPHTRWIKEPAGAGVIRMGLSRSERGIIADLFVAVPVRERVR